MAVYRASQSLQSGLNKQDTFKHSLRECCSLKKRLSLLGSISYDLGLTTPTIIEFLLNSGPNEHLE